MRDEIETAFGKCILVWELERKLYLDKKQEIDQLQFQSSKRHCLGDRVWVLRKLVQVLFWEKEKTLGWEGFLFRVDQYIDNLLKKNDYGLEKCIEALRKKISVL